MCVCVCVCVCVCFHDYLLLLDCHCITMVTQIGQPCQGSVVCVYVCVYVYVCVCLCVHVCVTKVLVDPGRDWMLCLESHQRTDTVFRLHQLLCLESHAIYIQSILVWTRMYSIYTLHI